VLPAVEPVKLGEGWTPMLRSRRNPNVWLKEEGANPTGTFKARGLALAVTTARHYGITKLAAPSAGNAGWAPAAYAAAAGIETHIFMPKDVPLANQVECNAYGAHLTLVDGLISDCGRMVAERKQAEGWFDVSTLKEPFRVEGKKTMGYELVEQLGWEYPDAVFYPTGGGVCPASTTISPGVLIVADHAVDLLDLIPCLRRVVIKVGTFAGQQRAV